MRIFVGVGLYFGLWDDQYYICECIYVRMCI